MEDHRNYDEEIRRRRRERIEKTRRSRRRRALIRVIVARSIALIIGVCLVALIFSGVRRLFRDIGEDQTIQIDGNDEYVIAVEEEPDEAEDTLNADFTQEESDFKVYDPEESVTPDEIDEEVDEPSELMIYSAAETEDTLYISSDEVVSDKIIFIDLNTDTVLGQRDAYSRMNPASMTKVLTVLVAAEHLESMDCLDDPFTITIDITDYAYVNDCSIVGFDVGETVTVRDLFYGTILPSGADAAAALAEYIAGSREAFVDLMNEKLVSMGLSDSAHMTNCVGLYDEDHCCSVYDMAMIMEAAISNELCLEVLSAHTYTTSSTPEHPDGITISNWFLRRIEDKDTGGEVIAGKTGYVLQSGNCAASFGVDAAGNGYICVTGGSTSSWRCIYDHVALYQMFAETG